jgi:hypothetical protein
MKPLVFIPVVVAASAGAAALLLKITGVRLNPSDPINAAVIAALAANAAILPMLRTRQKDAVAIVQLALIATVLHVVVTAGLTVAAIATGIENIHGPFIYWMLGAYWVSLAALVWQLRRLIIEMTHQDQGAKLT